MIRESLFKEIVMFFLFWIVGIAIWSIWLEGYYVPLAGFATAVAFRFVITLNCMLNEKAC